MNNFLYKDKDLKLTFYKQLCQYFFVYEKMFQIINVTGVLYYLKLGKKYVICFRGCNHL